MKKIILFVLLISLLTRLTYLFVAIPSLSNDEADLYLSSYLLAKSGTDYYNNRFFLTSGILTAKPSLPIYVGAITWLTNLEKSVANARLLFTLINSFTPLFFFLTIYLLTKNKKYSLIAFLTLNFSPWFSYISVTGYEAVLSFLLLNIALFISVSNLKKSTKLLLLIIDFFLIFNSYMAVRTYMPLLILITLFLGGFFQRERALKSFITLTLIAVSCTLLFTLFNYYSPNSELVKKEFSYLINHDETGTEGRVWYERLATNAPNNIKRILVNKITVRLEDYKQKYLSVINTNIFFLNGDPSSLYGTAGLIGLFYLSDFIFFVYGLINIRYLDKKLKTLLLFAFVGTIPVALTVTDITIILRAIVLLIPFILIIANGVVLLAKKSNKGILIFGVILILNWLSYLTIYTTRIAPLNSSAWQMNQKNLADKLDSINKENKVVVVEEESKEAFIQYAFYKIQNPLIIKDKLRNGTYSYSNVELKNTCPKKIEDSPVIYIMKRDFCGDLYKKYLMMSPEELNRQSIVINPNVSEKYRYVRE